MHKCLLQTCLFRFPFLIIPCSVTHSHTQTLSLSLFLSAFPSCSLLLLRVIKNETVPELDLETGNWGLATSQDE